MDTELLLGLALLIPLVIRLVVSRLGTTSKFMKYTIDVILVALFIAGLIILIAMI